MGAKGLPAPKCVYAHGWITVEGQKISKSRGNFFDPFALCDEFGADAIRYFLLREAPFGADFSWSEEKVRQRRNSDLGNDLGNLLRRSLAMLARYRDGLVPAPPERSAFGARFADLGTRVGDHILGLAFRDALEAVWELVGALNREIDERKPWELSKRGADAELDVVLYDLCEGLLWLGHLLAPFIPDRASEIHRQLGIAPEIGEAWNEVLHWGRLAAWARAEPGEPLFPRLEVAET